MKINISGCPYCNERSGVRKHGRARTGLQRYYCSHCRRTFQVKYIYHIYKNRIEEQKLDNAIPFTIADECLEN